MLYQSTRGGEERVASAKAIAQGLAEDGGLFIPDSFPHIELRDLDRLVTKPYKDRAAYIVSLFLDDFSKEELDQYASMAYSARSFDHPDVAPLHKIDDNTHFLELWHGPTCAFKDMALQIMPYLLSAALQKSNESREVCILVATSGDTGKAALEGFRDVPGTRIMVFYPRDGVSDVQRLQMVSQNGGNVNVVAVTGNFDDTQTGVKSIFSDAALRKEFSDNGYFLSSANSINWGRLVPQIAYYVSAYCDLIKNGELKLGEKVNFCVPTGNFGNILAAYYAERMGLPVGRLVCASNRNDVLTQFIATGEYDVNRPFYTTVSPSMDILVSSNLERLLFAISGRDGTAVSRYMSSLSKAGRYEVTAQMRDEIARVFAGGMCTEDETLTTIASIFNSHEYLIDTHTAVAVKVLNDYKSATGDDTTSVIVSTANPFKFCDSVLAALGKTCTSVGVEILDELSGITGMPIPAPLRELKSSPPRFNETVMPDGMKKAVFDFLRGR